MFGFFKKQNTTSINQFDALINNQIKFAERALLFHQKLLDSTPSRDKAICEAFLFNMWISYHFIADELKSTSAIQETKDERESLCIAVRKRLTAIAEKKSSSILKSKCDLNYLNNFNEFCHCLF